jgi:hypothetical protein
MTTRYWTCHWQIKDWRPDVNDEGQPIDHNAGNSFRKLGVASGDHIYVISLKGGQLFLGGRTVAGRIVDTAEAVRELGTDNLWNGQEHLLSQKGSGTRLDLHRRLSPELTRQLKFIFKDGPRQLFFVSANELYNQATRGVKELTPQSAELLDRIIDATDSRARDSELLTVTPEMVGSLNNAAVENEFHSPDEYPLNTNFVEGGIVSIVVNRFERDPAARAACIAAHGSSCHICGFNFAAAYGADAEGYIHVHHLRPLANAREAHKIEPATDLRPVCPNCHAIIHLGGNCRTIDQVREMMNSQSRKKS